MVMVVYHFLDMLVVATGGWSAVGEGGEGYGSSISVW
jgi:hypothetical protein